MSRRRGRAGRGSSPRRNSRLTIRSSAARGGRGSPRVRPKARARAPAVDVFISSGIFARTVRLPENARLFLAPKNARARPAHAMTRRKDRARLMRRPFARAASTSRARGALARGAETPSARCPSVPPSAPSFARAARTRASPARRSPIVPGRERCARGALFASRAPPDPSRPGAAVPVAPDPDLAPRARRPPPPPRHAPRLPVLLLLLLLLPLARWMMRRARSPPRPRRTGPQRRLRAVVVGRPDLRLPRGELRRPRSDPEWARDVEALQALRRACDPDAGTFIGDRDGTSTRATPIAAARGRRESGHAAARATRPRATSVATSPARARVRRFAPKRLALRARRCPRVRRADAAGGARDRGAHRLADWPTMDAFWRPAVDLAALETLRAKSSSVRARCRISAARGFCRTSGRSTSRRRSRRSEARDSRVCPRARARWLGDGLALRGAHALADARRALTQLETLERRDDDRGARTSGMGTRTRTRSGRAERVVRGGRLPPAEAISRDVERGMRSLATLIVRASGLVGTIPRAIGEGCPAPHPARERPGRHDPRVVREPHRARRVRRARENSAAGEIPPDADARAAALREVRLARSAAPSPRAFSAALRTRALEVVDVANMSEGTIEMKKPATLYACTARKPARRRGAGACSARARPPLARGLLPPRSRRRRLRAAHARGDRAPRRRAGARVSSSARVARTAGSAVSSDLAEINLSANDFGRSPRCCAGAGRRRWTSARGGSSAAPPAFEEDACVELPELLGVLARRTASPPSDEPRRRMRPPPRRPLLPGGRRSRSRRPARSRPWRRRSRAWTPS